LASALLTNYAGVKEMKTALLIIDVFNKMEFPEAKKLLKNALPAARAIAKLKIRFYKADQPVIYVNDNFGKWKSDWRSVFKDCSASEGRPLSEILPPDLKDFIILKPKHSGFYGTMLDVLLADLKIRRLVITGIAGNICVMFTVNDAHMRGYEIVVPRDAIASLTRKGNSYALRQYEKVFKISTTRSDRIRL
jgi:nicotinamidase-related amidase